MDGLIEIDLPVFLAVAAHVFYDVAFAIPQMILLAKLHRLDREALVVAATHLALKRALRDLGSARSAVLGLRFVLDGADVENFWKPQAVTTRRPRIGPIFSEKANMRKRSALLPLQPAPPA